ncbi:unnamed protein product, partial [Didymodactylos carnosus]
MDGISEAYKNSEKWTTRKEILSVVAPKISCKLTQSFLPGLTLYRFTAARRHALEYGTGRQVEHFIDFILSPHICTDLPFGERRLRLSTGVELYVPNTIRNMIPSRIVDQYFEYIAENKPGFPPLGRTSRLSLLNSCKASTRHGLQGVNYFAANASLVFDNLIDMVNDLSMDSDSKKTLVDDVKRGRMYLKTDYKVHVQKSSTITDHCINYALLQNQMTLIMPRKKLRTTIKSSATDNELLDRELAKLKMSTDAIEAWKCHQLRAVNQDRYGNLTQHLCTGKHRHRIERSSMRDMAMTMYHSKLENVGVRSMISLQLEEATPDDDDDDTIRITPDRGWALPKERKVTRLNESQIKYLTEKFDEGVQQRIRWKPEEVSAEMQRKKDLKNRLYCTPAEFLKPGQIRSFFSRLKSIRGKQTETVVVDEVEEEEDDEFDD